MKNLNMIKLGVQEMSAHEMTEQHGGDSCATAGMMLLGALIKSAVIVVFDSFKH